MSTFLYSSFLLLILTVVIIIIIIVITIIPHIYWCLIRPSKFFDVLNWTSFSRSLFLIFYRLLSHQFSILFNSLWFLYPLQFSLLFCSLQSTNLRLSYLIFASSLLYFCSSLLLLEVCAPTTFMSLYNTPWSYFCPPPFFLISINFIYISYFSLCSYS